MKLSYLLTSTILLFFVSCKKDKQELMTPADTVQEDDYTICIQDFWTTNIACEASGPNIYFVINNKFYSPTNANGDVPGDDEVYIYDGTSWTTKPCDIPFGTNHRNFYFSIGSKGYAAGLSTANKRFYEYNPVTNAWIRKADFPGEALYGFATFTIGTKGYVVGGRNNDGYTNKVWEYNPSTNAWRERQNLFLNRAEAVGFSINGKGYITNGTFPMNLGHYKSLVEYDPVADDWTEKADFPGIGRTGSQCFVIGGNAYVGGGAGPSGSDLKDFYRYKQSNNTWIRIDDLVVPGYIDNAGFTLNSKGYTMHFNGGAKLAKYSPPNCTTVIDNWPVGPQ